MQHRVTGKAAPQPLPARLCNEEQRKKQQEGVRKRKDQREPTRRESALAVAAGTVAVYASIQLTIRLFHHMRRKFLRRLLLDLCWALNELAAEGAVQQHWLDFGALLGIYRDGDLIEHDSDIDVSVLEVADWHKLLIGLQSRLPQYSMRVVIPSDDPNARFIRVYCHLGMADVFGATPCGDDRLLVDCGHGSCTEIGRAAVLPTGVLEWRGHMLAVPRDVPAALEQRYGPTWRVPRYADKGTDVIESNKPYMKLFRALSVFGIRI